MPLSFNNGGGGGDFIPFLRYSASTSSWSTADGAFQFKSAAFDLDRIETGWMLLAENQAPQWVQDESRDKLAQRPAGEGEWKRGFKVLLFSPKMFGEEQPVREWGTNSTGATMAMEKLFAAWEAEKPSDGQVAVVEFTGATPTKVGRGNTNVPTLNIVKLIDRPAELDDVNNADGNTEATSSSDAPSANTEDDDFADI